MFNLDWVLSSDTYNPSYPLTAYFYLIIFAVMIHLVLVIWPMIKIYRKFTKDHLLSIAKEVKKILTEEQKNDLKKWIKVELVYVLVPFIIALSFRLIAGQPEDFEWTKISVVVGFALATIWISLQIWQAIEMNRILNPLLSKWSAPRLISGGLGLFNITKSRMEILSKLKPEYVPLDDVEERIGNQRPENENDKDKFDEIAENVKQTGIKAIKTFYNIGQFGKSLFGKANKKTVEIVDKNIQKKVDEITMPTLYSQIKGRLITFTLAFLPLIAIYYVLPYLS